MPRCTLTPEDAQYGARFIEMAHKTVVQVRERGGEGRVFGGMAPLHVWRDCRV